MRRQVEKDVKYKALGNAQELQNATKQQNAGIAETPNKCTSPS